MTPEHDDLTQEQVMEALVEMTCVSAIYPRHRQAAKQTIAAITQLQEQVASYEDTASYLSGLSTDQADELMAENKELQEQVKELENHNKDKSQLLANYKEQITSLVKEKHRREK